MLLVHFTTCGKAQNHEWIGRILRCEVFCLTLYKEK